MTLNPAVSEKDLFFRQIVESGDVPMIVTTPAAVIVYVNPAFSRLTGYALHEMVGKKPSLLRSGKTPDSVYSDMWQTISQGMSWHGEFINRRKTGGLYTESIYISCIKNEMGVIEGYVGIWVDVSLEKDEREEMRVLAITDPLTGLFNRRGFITHAVQAMKMSRREKTGFQILLMDVDGLKGINDRYGHSAGDNLLMGVAQVLRKAFRDCDILARFGGDEFAAVLFKAGADALGIIKKRLMKSLVQYNAENNRPYTLSLSLGTAAFDPGKTQFLDQLLQEADRQLYREKDKRKATQQRKV